MWSKFRVQAAAQVAEGQVERQIALARRGRRRHLRLGRRAPFGRPALAQAAQLLALLAVQRGRAPAKEREAHTLLPSARKMLCECAPVVDAGAADAADAEREGDGAATCGRCMAAVRE